MSTELKYRIVGAVFIMFGLILMCINVEAKESNQPILKQVEVTAYYDSKRVNMTATGRPLVENLTMAGRIEDLGKTALLYDDSFHLIGIYEFTDVGYGQPTGNGVSVVRKGMSKGTIETGQCVDVYMKTKSDCIKWGRRTCYIQIVKAVG